jgi:sialidase-1
MARIDVEHRQVLFDPAHAVNQGSIVHLQDGRLMLGFNQERTREHADSGQSCVMFSGDLGDTWTDPQVVQPYTDYTGNWDCAFAEVGSGELIMHTRLCSFMASTAVIGHSEQTTGPPPGRPYRLKRQTGYGLCRSADAGATWSPLIPVNTAPMADSGTGPYIAGGSGAGHIIELPDGGLLMPLHGSISREWPTRTGETIRSLVLRSDDLGHNWEYWATVAFDAASILDFFEPAMARLESGRLVCLLRSQARPGRVDHLWCVHSDDDGASWSPPVRTPIWGFPADVVQLQDGRVLAVYGYRRAPWGVRAAISDDGITWRVESEFVVRAGGAAASSQSQYWHIGYPTVTRAADGTVIAAYHEYVDNPGHGEAIQAMWISRFHV